MINKESVLESFKDNPRLKELIEDPSLNVIDISYSQKTPDKFVEALKALIKSTTDENTEQKIFKDIEFAIRNTGA